MSTFFFEHINLSNHIRNCNFLKANKMLEQTTDTPKPGLSKFTLSFPLKESQHQDSILMLEGIQERIMRAGANNDVSARIYHKTKSFSIKLFEFEAALDWETIADISAKFENMCRRYCKSEFFTMEQLYLTNDDKSLTMQLLPNCDSLWFQGKITDILLSFDIQNFELEEQPLVIELFHEDADPFDETILDEFKVMEDGIDIYDLKQIDFRKNDVLIAQYDMRYISDCY